MARITVEDCLEKVSNRFQLVLIATKRARQLDNGRAPLVEPDNDKSTVIALREIAEGLIDESILDQSDDLVGTAELDFSQALGDGQPLQVNADDMDAQDDSDQQDDQGQPDSLSEDAKNEDADQAQNIE